MGVKVNPRIKTLHEIFALEDREMQQITRDVDSVFRKHERRLFQTEGAHGGSKWAPLSKRYEKIKNRKFKAEDRRSTAQIARAALRGRKLKGPGARKILDRTGALMRSLSTTGEGHIARHQDLKVQLGTSVEYAIYHHEGSNEGGSVASLARQFLSSGRSGLPKRDPIQHTEDQVGEYLVPIKERLTQKIARIAKILRARGLVAIAEGAKSA